MVVRVLDKLLSLYIQYMYIFYFINKCPFVRFVRCLILAYHFEQIYDLYWFKAIRKGVLMQNTCFEQCLIFSVF